MANNSSSFFGSLLAPPPSGGQPRPQGSASAPPRPTLQPRPTVVSGQSSAVSSPISTQRPGNLSSPSSVKSAQAPVQLNQTQQQQQISTQATQSQQITSPNRAVVAQSTPSIASVPRATTPSSNLAQTGLQSRPGGSAQSSSPGPVVPLQSANTSSASIFSSPFSVAKAKGPMDASVIELKNMWDDMNGVLASLEALQRKKIDEASEVESVFQAKID